MKNTSKTLSNSAKWRAFIIRRLAEYATYATIYEEISSPNAKKLYGFTPFKQSYDSLYKRAKRIPPEEINEEREKWLKELRDIPLAQKKVRILALCKIYQDGDKAVRLKALKQIKEEVGEDKYLAAIAKQGKVDVNVTVTQKSEKEVQNRLLNNPRLKNLFDGESQK